MAIFVQWSRTTPDRKEIPDLVISDVRGLGHGLLEFNAEIVQLVGDFGHLLHPGRIGKRVWITEGHDLRHRFRHAVSGHGRSSRRHPQPYELGLEDASVLNTAVECGYQVGDQ